MVRVLCRAFYGAGLMSGVWVRSYVGRLGSVLCRAFGFGFMSGVWVRFYVGRLGSVLCRAFGFGFGFMSGWVLCRAFGFGFMSGVWVRFYVGRGLGLRIYGAGLMSRRRFGIHLPPRKRTGRNGRPGLGAIVRRRYSRPVALAIASRASFALRAKLAAIVGASFG
jgi:hypothetical protein